MLCDFSMASKCVPIAILDYYFTALDKEGITALGVHVDEDGALADNTEFCDFLLAHSITLESSGGYASFLNGKIDCSHCTIAQMVCAMLLNSGLPNNLWCYAAETTVDFYHYSYHSALCKTPYEAWYGIKPHIICVFGVATFTSIFLLLRSLIIVLLVDTSLVLLSLV